MDNVTTEYTGILRTRNPRRSARRRFLPILWVSACLALAAGGCDDGGSANRDDARETPRDDRRGAPDTTAAGRGDLPANVDDAWYEFAHARLSYPSRSGPMPTSWAESLESFRREAERLGLYVFCDVSRAQYDTAPRGKPRLHVWLGVRRPAGPVPRDDDPVVNILMLTFVRLPSGEWIAGNSSTAKFLARTLADQELARFR